MDEVEDDDYVFGSLVAGGTLRDVCMACCLFSFFMLSFQCI